MKFGGIGVRIAVENQVIRVIGITPESAAFEAGIQAGDFIIKIDGVESILVKKVAKCSVIM